MLGVMAVRPSGDQTYVKSMNAPDVVVRRSYFRRSEDNHSASGLDEPTLVLGQFHDDGVLDEPLPVGL